MKRLFQRPFEKETLDDWAKMTIDIAKVAILALPVIIYNNDELLIKLFNAAALLTCAYSSLVMNRFFRKMKGEM